MPDKILISEIYGPVIQGEGALAGHVSHFIRTAGCEYRCSWCDSMHAVDPQQIKATANRMTASEIVDTIEMLPPAPWVTLSGGDPVAWDLSEIVFALTHTRAIARIAEQEGDRLHGPLFKLAVETQGALWQDWLEGCDLVTCSPKPPSSGMAERFSPQMLQKYAARLHGRLVLKIVIFDERDLAFAEKVKRLLLHVPFYLSAGSDLPATRDNILDRYRWLAERVVTQPDLQEAIVLPQLHALIWGNEKGR